MEAKLLENEPKSAAKIQSLKEKQKKIVDLSLKRNHYRQDALIEILHKAQEFSNISLML